MLKFTRIASFCLVTSIFCALLSFGIAGQADASSFKLPWSKSATNAKKHYGSTQDPTETPTDTRATVPSFRNMLRNDRVRAVRVLSCTTAAAGLAVALAGVGFGISGDNGLKHLPENPDGEDRKKRYTAELNQALGVALGSTGGVMTLGGGGICAGARHLVK